MKILLMLAISTVSLISCGKRNTSGNGCNREAYSLKCQAIHTPNYGLPYAQKICDEEIKVKKCY